MNRWKGKVAVVTGASGGIGAAIACKLVEEGLQVVGLARRKERIDELAKKLQDKPGKLCGIRADMSQENDIIEAFKIVEKNFGAIHILINNAAILNAGDFVKDGNIDCWRKTFDTNVLGLCIATKEAIKIMKNKKIDGHIIHINSVAGHKILSGFVGLSVYPATKYAVTALAETLRIELASENCKIKVTSLSPGAVDTPMYKNVQHQLGDDEKFSKNMPMLCSDDIANATLYILSTPLHVCIDELIIHAIGEKL